MKDYLDYYLTELVIMLHLKLLFLILHLVNINNKQNET